jgi:hypothetical protein
MVFGSWASKPFLECLHEEKNVWLWYWRKAHVQGRDGHAVNNFERRSTV